MTPSIPFDVDALVRPNIRSLVPYRSARDDFKEGILLDANENPFENPAESDIDLNRYPDPHHTRLKTKLAAIKGVDASQIFLGVGSDEAIDLVFRVFCRPGIDNVLITPPTYGMYKVSATINDVEARAVLLTTECELDAQAVLKQVDQNTKAIFLCSPNNPTGNDLATEEIETILNSFNGIVVVDEAYIDFAERASWNQRLAEFPNLLVLQTFSKAFGLAGLRVGMAFANAPIISWYMRVKSPYNLNKISLELAEKALNNTDKIAANVTILLQERARLEAYLLQKKEVLKCWKSDANFLLFSVENAFKIYQQLASLGVIIRYRGHEPHCENGLRLTIGTPVENQQFIDAFEQCLASTAAKR